MNISCHCGNVRISANEPQILTQCNCSICSRYAALWGYYPPDEPLITIGAYGTHDYCWGDQEIDFFRCAHCGCVTHYQTKPGQPDPKIALNYGLARKQVADIPVRFFDGAGEL